MSIWRWSAIACVIGLFTATLPGCVVPDGGYGYGDGYEGDADIGLDYYDPGVEYGGWEPGYQVGPFYHDGHHPEGGGHHFEGGAHPQQPAYKPAPASRPMPSIPVRSRFNRSKKH
jgi:hypothetical protein